MFREERAVTLEKKIPVVVLSGFLGSGKTTLLAKMLGYAKNQLRPAVIMNEAGDVNLDGQLVDETISMREMLSGCICCTISGDVGMEIRSLAEESSPDLILIEATGVANPMEIMEAVTEAAFLVPIEVRAMISVVDVAHFLAWHRKGSGKTYRLMRDQIRCASTLLLNKADLVSAEELDEAKRLAAALNPKAAMQTTVHCEITNEWLQQLLQEDNVVALDHVHRDKHMRQADCRHHSHDHDEHYHSYDHVMIHSHYFEGPLDRSRIERMIRLLPETVYRAKGIFTEAGTEERMMFQYAYRQLNILRIEPQGRVQDVAVFLGEQFPKHELQKILEQTVMVQS